MLPIDKVQIKTLHKSDIDLGKSIYQEAAGWVHCIQDSQGTRRTYLSETAELAYHGRNKHGGWG
jgi:hypothetical protein